MLLRIEEALDATAQDGITYEDWSDAAQIYLATNAAEAEKEELHAAETEQLARGMRISLEEAESKKANELPLHEQNPEELSTKFQDSPVHSMLQSESQWETLLGCQDVRKLVVDYLKMEQSCKRWFPGVEAYFEKVADDLRPLITENDSSTEKVKQFLEKNTELLEAEVFRYPMESHQLPTIFAPYIKEQEVDLTSD